MRSPDVVFRELGQLYDFYREIAKFKIGDKPDTRRGRAPRANRHAASQEQADSQKGRAGT